MGIQAVGTTPKAARKAVQAAGKTMQNPLHNSWDSQYNIKCSKCNNTDRQTTTTGEEAGSYLLF